jgi:hypothetical protein
VVGSIKIDAEGNKLHPGEIRTQNTGMHKVAIGERIVRDGSESDHVLTRKNYGMNEGRVNTVEVDVNKRRKMVG